VLKESLHQQVQVKKTSGEGHIRVPFTVITSSQTELPLGSPACHHASESLDTSPAGPMASGADFGRSHSGQVRRLVPFVVALRQHRRMTGCQPVGKRVPTALPGRRRANSPYPVWSFPQNHRSRSRRTPTAARVTPRVTRDTLPDISSTQPRASDASSRSGPFAEAPAGNHSRFRLKPSPISDRHVIELAVRSLEALRLKTSGHARVLSHRARLAGHPWPLSPGRRTKHPVTARSLTSFRDSAHLSSP